MTGVRTVTLTEFLLARIAEDEAVARAATDGAWTVMPSTEPDHDGGAAIYATRPGQSTYIVVDSTDREEGRPACGVEDAGHVVRWQPARVLVECEAKRRIVDEAFKHAAEIAADRNWGCRHSEQEIRAGLCGESEFPLLRLLAMPYADHADYRPDWKP